MGEIERSLQRGKRLAAFDEELSQVFLRGQWKYDEELSQLTDGPRPAGNPHLWKWESVYPKLLEATEVIKESFTARRSLVMTNPGLHWPGTTHTMAMCFQIITPGELAWAHRHSFAALRFVIQGNHRLFTVVDGETCPMENYDLVLTPSWTWHDHHNRGKDHAIWLDVVDVALIKALNVPFYEPYPGNRTQAIKKHECEHLQARAGLARPTWEHARRMNLPVRYPWAEIEPKLTHLAKHEGSPYDGISLEYVNPVTGGPTLPTMSCWIQLLRPGEHTRAHRHTSSTMYFVVRGEGRTIVNNQELSWRRHDAFVVPNWAWHEHRNGSRGDDALLFSVNDIPVMESLGLYREEPEVSLHARPAPAVAPLPLPSS